MKTGRESGGQSSVCRSMCACRRIAASPVSSAPGKLFARRTRGAAAWALPSVALALVPKCPMCIAAYLALGGGLGISISTAAHLRSALLWLCWSALVLLTVRLTLRFAPTRMKTRTAAAARVALRNAWQYIPQLPMRGTAFASASSIPLLSAVYGYIKQGHRPQI